MVNSVQLIGRLAADPDLRYTGEKGTPYCRLRVATDRVVRGTRRTEFHDVVAWNALAEQCAQALTKGQLVYVDGRLESSSWEKEGQRHRTIRIVADRVQFLGAGYKSERAADAPDEEMTSTPAAEAEEDQ